MIYELRIYQCIPGKLPALLKRFETKTLDIWKKHGIRPTGFWTVLIGSRSDGSHGRGQSEYTGSFSLRPRCGTS